VGETPLLRAGVVDYEAIANTGLTSEDFGETVSTAWAREYRRAVADAELVEVDLDGLTYLFDLKLNRTLGVYGLSRGQTAPRPSGRLRGHPSYNRPGEAPTDRGHLAAHSIGGVADLNLVAQDHFLNISGGWRAFERYAQKHPGTPFALQARYLGESDRPSSFVYAQLRDSRFIYREFDNDPSTAA
jgi:hypothetical protein